MVNPSQAPARRPVLMRLCLYKDCLYVNRDLKILLKGGVGLKSQISQYGLARSSILLNNCATSGGIFSMASAMRPPNCPS